MRAFTCQCGQPLFFDNDRCGRCGGDVGFDPARLEMVRLDETTDQVRCANHASSILCNWLRPSDDPMDQCISCRLTRTLPPPGGESDERLAKSEAAKRRWLYGLLRLGLSVIDFHQRPEGGLAFDFLEDQASNPHAPSAPVMTGHANGLITVNMAEADPVERARAQENMDERYRTLVGHMRHESGHFYWDELVRDSTWLEGFRALFGDERADYAQALQLHYAQGPSMDWPAHYISSYASSHPWEDWAETWAHYLHLADTLETAGSFGLCPAWDALRRDFDQLIHAWRDVSVMLNELSRSMGQNDSYPFVLQDPVVEKLRFIHDIIIDGSSAPPSAAPDVAVQEQSQ